MLLRFRSPELNTFSNRPPSQLYLRLLDVFVVLLIAFAAGVSIANLTQQDQTPKSQLSTFQAQIVDPFIAPEHSSWTMSLERLRSQVLSANTALTLGPQQPLLLRFEIDGNAVGNDITLELDKVRADRARIWYRDMSLSSDSSQRSHFHEIPSEPTSRGISGRIAGKQHSRLEVIISVSAKLPSRFSLLIWDSKSFPNANAAFGISGGLLFGSLLAIGVLSAAIALVNRDRTFWVFAGLTIATLRVAGVNGGWDLIWLGFSNITPALVVLQHWVLVIYAVLTVALFQLLFSAHLRPWATNSLRFCQISFLPIALLSVFASYVQFLQVFWAVSIFGVTVMLLSLARICAVHPSTTASLYAGSWAITFGGIGSEILYMSGKTALTVSFLNTRTGAVLTSTFLAIALADRIRTERLARLSAETVTRQALDRLQSTYDSIPIGLFTLNLDGTFASTNPAFKKMVSAGHNLRDEAISQWHEFFSKADLGNLRLRLQDSGTAEMELTRNDNMEWYRVHARRETNVIEGSIEEITAKRTLRLHLQRLALHDTLTDLLNRRGLEETLPKIATNLAQGLKSCIAYIDLDRFKLVNDMFGHFAGDLVIQEVAQRLRTCCKESAAISRLGGDEFVIVFLGEDLARVTSYCADILAAVNTLPFRIEDKEFSIVASIGLLELNSARDIEHAISAADRACAEAKRHGGGRLVTCDESDADTEAHFRELKMVRDLKGVLPVDRLQMVLQPIVSLQSRYASTMSYESLLRTKDEYGRLQPPGPLIQAAERHGFMSRLDWWTVNTMLEWLESNSDVMSRINYCAINLSGASLNDARFLQDIASLVRQSPRTTKLICFEITETVALYDLSNTQRFIDAMRTEGAKIALDDFGAGYTSFNYLKSLKADLVKIDGSFVRTLDVDRSNYAITRTIADLTREMGLSCVAEWVESVEVVRLLREMGVDYGQGWAFSKPLALDEVLKVLSFADVIMSSQVRDALSEQRLPVFRKPSVMSTAEQHRLANDKG